MSASTSSSSASASSSLASWPSSSSVHWADCIESSEARGLESLSNDATTGEEEEKDGWLVVVVVVEKERGLVVGMRIGEGEVVLKKGCSGVMVKGRGEGESSMDEIVKVFGIGERNGSGRFDCADDRLSAEPLGPLNKATDMVEGTDVVMEVEGDNKGMMVWLKVLTDWDIEFISFEFLENAPGRNAPGRDDGGNVAKFPKTVS